MPERLNLRINRETIRELEKLAEETNLDRAVLAKKIIIKGIQREKLNLIIQKYIRRITGSSTPAPWNCRSAPPPNTSPCKRCSR